MFPELKIKIKSLAAEIAMIRADEVKYKSAARKARAQIILMNGGKPPKWASKVRTPREEYRTFVESRGTLNERAWRSLRAHRAALKVEYRSALLAYAFLRGRSYLQCEAKNTKKQPDWAGIKYNIRRFGGVEPDADTFTAWAEAGSPAA